MMTAAFECPPEFSLPAMQEKKKQIWSLLFAASPGGDGATLYLFAGGKCIRSVTGRAATLRADYLPLYAGCELRECRPLRAGDLPEEAWETATAPNEESAI